MIELVAISFQQVVARSDHSRLAEAVEDRPLHIAWGRTHTISENPGNNTFLEVGLVDWEAIKVVSGVGVE